MSRSDSEHPRSNSFLNITVICACLAFIGYGIYYYETTPLSEDEVFVPIPPIPSISTEEVQENEATETVTNSTEQIQQNQNSENTMTPIDVEPKVELDESDAFVLITADKFSQINLINIDQIRLDIVRNTVVFIDNFSRGEIIRRFSPVNELETPFSIERVENNLYIAPSSFQRYDAYTNYLTSIDSKVLVNQYKKLKPLIDEAFAEISRPGAQFEDTINESIELVLATPIVEGPIKVTSPSVMYLYDDPDLENLNDAQKLMLRMGADNLQKIQTTLRTIQEEFNNNG